MGVARGWVRRGTDSLLSCGTLKTLKPGGGAIGVFGQIDIYTGQILLILQIKYF